MSAITLLTLLRGAEQAFTLPLLRLAFGVEPAYLWLRESRLLLGMNLCLAHLYVVLDLSVARFDQLFIIV